MNADGDPDAMTGHRALVVGLGVSGLSAARWLSAHGYAVAVTDSREHPPQRDALESEVPDAALFTGGFSEQALARADLVVLSPGVPRDDPFVRAALERGLPVVGDVELFARVARAPVVAVTGANGKSTVATLLGMMAVCAGRDVQTGGNLGKPALELAATPADLYVLELSSFQLESVESLNAAAAALLNISPDHLDRYPDIDAYAAAKARIWRGDGAVVANRDDARVAGLVPRGRKVYWFGASAPRSAEAYGIDGAGWLCRGDERLLESGELQVKGGHNAANALAALALGEAVGLPRVPMIDALRSFRGLPHRMEYLGAHRGVEWYDDSKATNVGAAMACIDGMAGGLVVILGGDGKGQDFTPLAVALEGRARAVILMGRDAPRIEAALGGKVPALHAAGMDEAVRIADSQARPGDTVLLSPSCSSLDMFDGFEARGRAFAAAFREMAE